MRLAPAPDLEPIPLDEVTVQSPAPGAHPLARLPRWARRLTLGCAATLGAAVVGYNVGAARPYATADRTPPPDSRGFLWECDGRLVGVVALGRQFSFTNGFVELAGAGASYGAPATTDGRGRIRVDEPAVLHHGDRFTIRFSAGRGDVREVTMPVTTC